MKYTLEERIDNRRHLYTHELTYKEAMKQYDIGKPTAPKFLTDYKRANSIPVQNHQNSPPAVHKNSSTDIEIYMSMSKEELISEHILAQANELKAKKEYDLKGVGIHFLNKWNKKS